MSVRRWSTAVRRGARMQAALPGPLAPGDARAVARALRTARAVREGSDWVWPHWLVRQRDPASPAFVPQGDLPFVANVTHRNWTVVGTLDAARLALVDPRGLVTPAPEGWSLDWWIGADDRWHVPAREVGVRQRLLGASPVVETTIRIPGGDAVQRVYGARRSSQEGGGELVVVEVENRSKLPVALALAVRPLGPRGAAAVERIDLAGATVVVDGRPALLLPRPPARVAVSTLAGGDSAAAVLSGEAGPDWPGPVHCPGGAAQAAFVHPLAHGATLRAALVLDPPEGGGAGGWRGRRRARRRSALPGGQAGASASASAPTGFPAVVPGAEDVARGWEAQGRRGPRLELPDPRLAEAVDASRRFLLLLHRQAAATADPADGGLPVPDVAQVVAALDLYGLRDEATDVLVSFAEHQRGDGRFAHRHPGAPGAVRRSADAGANGAVLWALARHWRLGRDRSLVEALATSVARAAHWIERTHRQDDRRPDRSRAGDRPAGPAAGQPWHVAGLRAAAELLRVAGQPDTAAAAGAVAAASWPAVEETAVDPADVAALAEAVAMAVPLGLLPADDARVVATADALRQLVPADGRALPSPGDLAALDPALTLRLAAVEVRAGDPRGLGRLAWLLDVATPTWTWPSALHPRLLGGTAGDGHDLAVTAAFLAVVRDLLAREDGDGGLALASAVPDAWWGQGWEVHGLPTDHGRLSYAVRWHGPRPALLWELEPHDGPDARPVRLSAPGLDPAWSSTQAKGEALLAPVERPTPAGAPAAPDAPDTPQGSLS